jgi:hypothetical protein
VGGLASFNGGSREGGRRGGPIKWEVPVVSDERMRRDTTTTRGNVDDREGGKDTEEGRDAKEEGRNKQEEEEEEEEEAEEG